MGDKTTDVVVISPANLEILETDFIVSRVEKLKEIKEKIMEPHIHYDLIPGCGDKPAIKKEGSELLCMAFQLCPKYELTVNDLGGRHREFSYQGHIIHIPTGKIVAYGVGSCSTMESKYRYREGKRLCPQCNKEAIIKGKEEYGGGWLCFKKLEGCGAKFEDGDTSIEVQKVGRVENEDLADQYNTCMKIGKKRCQSDLVLTATAASFLFMPDPSEFPPDPGAGPPTNQKQKKQKPAPPKSKSNGEKKAIPNQVKAIQTLLGKIYEDATDNVKHAGAAGMLGLDEIKSFNDLTFEQASKLIEILGEKVNG